MAKKKVRVELRRNLGKPPRQNDLTRDFKEQAIDEDSVQGNERVRAKGELSRHRTIIADSTAPEKGTAPVEVMPLANEQECRAGRVIRVHGLQSIVQAEDGSLVRCTVRRLLKSLVTDERNVVTTGDRVWFRDASAGEGVIEQIEPRRGILTRASRRREHVLVSNVDQVVIVMSLVEPDLKPHLIDRYLASAQKGDLKPIICLNKADLVERVNLQSLIGSYTRLGIPTLLTSAKTGEGIARLKELLKGKATVFSGQSGVGKSSLLNAIQPGLALRVSNVSQVNQKGKHTTTTAELISLDFGGWVVDTPGIRSLALWDVIAREVEGFFVEFNPFVSRCSFPDCTHTHELGCGVKRAVELRFISARRYHSYLGMIEELE